MQYQRIPAGVGDIVKKVASHYASDLVDGEHFVVLDVFSGDDTAVVLGRDGKLKTLSYPEEYEVVDSVQNMIDKMSEDSRVLRGKVEAKITEEKANGTYIDIFEWLGIKLSE